MAPGSMMPARRSRVLLLRDVGEAVSFASLFALVQIAARGALQLLGVSWSVLRVGSPVAVAVAGVGAALILVIYVALVRLFERRPVVELFGPGGGVLFGRGVALGLLLFSLTIAISLLIGGGRIGDHGSLSGAGLALLGSLFAAVMEEVMFRGLLFRLIERHAGTGIALAATAVLFGAVHALNPGASWLSSIALAVEAGVLLGAAYAVARNLWFPIGLHLAWDFAEGGIFGTTVSGFSMPGLTSTVLTGRRWITGGSFGPEAGVPALAVCVVTSVLLLRRVRRWGPRSAV